MADYGAFLGFDDAEQVSSKNFDADKRNLILAGNRRGSHITIKEAAPNSRQWRTRFVNTFCPRGFSAIRLPDATLGSRTITIPLVRTADKRKGDANISDETCWTRSPNEIRQDLWLIALANLSEMRDIDRKAARRAALTGRNLEAWRGVLAVALLLDDNDDRGKLQREVGNAPTTLFERMNRLSLDYQTERHDIETSDLTILVLRAIAALIVGSADEKIDLNILRSLGHVWTLQTKSITERAQRIVEDEELDFDVEFVNSKRIGRILSKLRLPKERQGGTGKRGWQICLSDFENLLSSFTLLKRDVSASHADTQNINVTNVTNVPNVTDQEINCDISDISDIGDVCFRSENVFEINVTKSNGNLFDWREQSQPVNVATEAGDTINIGEEVYCWRTNCRASLHSATVCPNCGTNQDEIDF